MVSSTWDRASSVLRAPLRARSTALEAATSWVISAASCALRTRCSAWDTSTATARRVARRCGDRTTVSVVKKSMVPTVRRPPAPVAVMGKHTPERTPARVAAGARTQSVTCPRSGTKTTSPEAHARPDSPVPLAKVAASVASRNSWFTCPDSRSKRSTGWGPEASSSAQKEP